jgi:hypothetical protein
MEVHPTDDQLNEYLDGALDPQQVQRIDRHLAECPACARRLEELRTLFSELAELPDEPLGRDLAPGVVAALRTRRTPAWRGWVMLAVQLAAAGALVGVAWSWLTAQAGRLGLAVPTLPVLRPAYPVHLFGLFTAFNTALLQAGQTLQAALRVTLPVPRLPGWLNSLAPPWQPWQAGLLIAAAGLLWLVGNTILFKPTSQHLERRNS